MDDDIVEQVDSLPVDSKEQDIAIYLYIMDIQDTSPLILYTILETFIRRCGVLINHGATTTSGGRIAFNGGKRSRSPAGYAMGACPKGRIMVYQRHG